MPVQRVPRYSLLLNDLIKNTPETHPDYTNLQNATALVSSIVNFINESVRKSDHAKRIEELSIKGANFHGVISPSRFLVYEVPIKIVENKRKETKHFFLFNDVLVSVKETQLKNGVDLSLPEFLWPLNLVWVQETDDTFEMIGPNGIINTASHKIHSPEYSFLRELTSRIQAWLSRDDRYTSVNPLPSVRYGSYITSTDEHYEGLWKNGLKDGHGIATFGGCTYDGEWKNGKRHGQGQMHFVTGEIYSGEWVENMQSGLGTLTLASGEIIYEGHWENSCYNGRGKFTSSNGDIYDGEWVNGSFSGYGEFKSVQDSIRYLGRWKNNLFEGKGLLTLGPQCWYDGDFKYGLKHGQGIQSFPSGYVYNGDFSNGKAHGKGLMELIHKNTDHTTSNQNFSFQDPGHQSLTNGISYDGFWTWGVRNGFGKCVYHNSSEYEGFWDQDRYHGHGTLRTSFGSIYSGEWVSGRLEGRATATYSSGAHYEGFWLNNLYHKNGIFTGEPSNPIKSYDGEWSFGKMHNKGHLILRNNDSYKGSFKNGQIHGSGTYSLSNGSSITGKWVNGQRDGKATFTTFVNDKKVCVSGHFEDSPNALLLPVELDIYLQPQVPITFIGDIETPDPYYCIYNLNPQRDTPHTQ